MQVVFEGSSAQSRLGCDSGWHAQELVCHFYGKSGFQAEVVHTSLKHIIKIYSNFTIMKLKLFINVFHALRTESIEDTRTDQPREEDAFAERELIAPFAPLLILPAKFKHDTMRRCSIPRGMEKVVQIDYKRIQFLFPFTTRPIQGSRVQNNYGISV